MTKPKVPEPPKASKAAFRPVTDMQAFLENRGDLRAVFDQVHRHFFDQLTWPDTPMPRVIGKKPD